MSIIGMKDIMRQPKTTALCDQIVKKSLTILFIGFLIFFISPFWGSARAQTLGNVRIASLDISLYPEFNRPSMLVKYKIRLAEDSPLPAEITLQIPADAQSLSVSNMDEENNAISQQLNVEDIGLWKDVTFTATTRDIEVEYYDPNLVKEEDQRIFEFEWLSIYPVDSLNLTIRQPYGGSDIHSQPAMDEKYTGPGNIEYYTGEMRSVPAGDTFTLSLMYTKNTSNPAYPALPVAPVVDVNEATPGKTPSPLSVVLWLLGFAVAVLVLVGVYYVWFHYKIREKQTGVVDGVGIRNPEKQMVFCHECGKRSNPGDIFCSNCGTELRRVDSFTKPPQTQDKDSS